MSFLDFFRVFASFIEIFAGILMIFSLFRIKIRDHLSSILWYSLFMSSFIYYLYFDIQFPSAIIVVNIILLTVFCTLIVSLPVYYSLLVAVSGVLASSLVEMLTIILLMKAGVVNAYTFHVDRLSQSVSLSASAMIFLLLTALLQKFKIGFLFREKYFIVKRITLKTYSFAFVLIVFLTMLMLMNPLLLTPFQSVPRVFIMIGFTVVIFLFSYKKNKNMIS